MNSIDVNTASPQLILDRLDLTDKEDMLAEKERLAIHSEETTKSDLIKIYKLAIYEGVPIARAREYLAESIGNQVAMDYLLAKADTIPEEKQPQPNSPTKTRLTASPAATDDHSSTSSASKSEQQNNALPKVKQQKSAKSTSKKGKPTEKPTYTDPSRTQLRTFPTPTRSTPSGKPSMAVFEQSKGTVRAPKSSLWNRIWNRDLLGINTHTAKAKPNNVSAHKSADALKPPTISTVRHAFPATPITSHSMGKDLPFTLNINDLRVHYQAEHQKFRSYLNTAPILLENPSLSKLEKAMIIRYIGTQLFEHYYPQPNLAIDLKFWGKQYHIPLTHFATFIDAISVKGFTKENHIQILNSLTAKPFRAHPTELELDTLTFMGYRSTHNALSDSWELDSHIRQFMFDEIKATLGENPYFYSNRESRVSNQFTQFVRQVIYDPLNDPRQDPEAYQNLTERLNSTQVKYLREFFFDSDQIDKNEPEPSKTIMPSVTINYWDNIYAIFALIKMGEQDHLAATASKKAAPLKDVECTLKEKAFSFIPVNEHPLSVQRYKGFEFTRRPLLYSLFNDLLNGYYKQQIPSGDFASCVHPMVVSDFWDYLHQESNILTANNSFQWNLSDDHLFRKDTQRACYAHLGDLLSPAQTRLTGAMTASQSLENNIYPFAKDKAGKLALHANWVGHDQPVILSQQPRQPNFAQWWSAVAKYHVNFIIDLTSDDDNFQVSKPYYLPTDGKMSFTPNPINAPTSTLGDDKHWISLEDLPGDELTDALKLNTASECEVSKSLVNTTAHKIQYRDVDDEHYDPDRNLEHEHHVERLHFKGWADYSAVTPKTLLALSKQIRAHADSISHSIGSRCRTLIHCRGGVGRAGTLSAALQVMNAIDSIPKDELHAVRIFDEITYAILVGRQDRGPSYIQTQQQLDLVLSTALLYAAETLSQR